MAGLWAICLNQLEHELSAQQYNTWIRPLQAVEGSTEIRVFAPNRFVLDWVNEKFLSRMEEILSSNGGGTSLSLEVGSSATPQKPINGTVGKGIVSNKQSDPQFGSNLNPAFTFDNFIQGKSNQLCRAAAIQVSEARHTVYNPLLIYGGVGLGKTHLVHACGNAILNQHPGIRVVYLHSERFVSDMVSALQRNTIDEFKKFYRSINVLLIDDIQFFAGKERSQEEFFHVFNALLEGQHQVVMTCDRYPKNIKGLEDRLKSRFGWGLTVAIEPPELETRVAILKNKAEQVGFNLADEVAFFIAKRIYSNVRELEGALRRVVALANFTRALIDLELTREALKDIIAAHDNQITVEGIQKTVAEYFKIRTSDLLSKSRKRLVTRPRQLAMMLAKELTNCSLPEIGAAFGGRDHTTVIHACDRVRALRGTDRQVAEDSKNLVRILSG